MVICVALSEKSTKRHDDDLKTFLDDMRSLPGTVRSIGVTPSSIPSLTGQLASLGFDLYLNDPLQSGLSHRVHPYGNLENWLFSIRRTLRNRT